MSAVSEAVARRMTLGYLADTYGLELDPDFASGVTVTSIADDVDSVAPGSLYVPAQSVDVKRLEEARARGAYAALVPPSMKHEDGPAQMPLLRARLTSRQLGDIASDIAGTPSNALAIFVVGSDDPKRSERYASCVADFLHMLGNPVGVVKSSGSTSLERELDLTYPLSILDVQQTLSVCAEDGAAAMVFALNDRTLKSDALTSVNVDVIGLDSARDLRQPTPSGTGEDSRAGEGGEAASPSGQWASGEEPAGSAGDARDDLAQARQLGAGFGFEVDEQTHVARADAQSDLLAAQAPFASDRDSIRELSLAIAMVMAAVGGSLFALIHAMLCLKFKANQVISGVVVNILAMALTAYLTKLFNRVVFGATSDKFVLTVSSRITIPGISKIPVLGAVFTNLYPFELVIVVVAFVAWFVMYKTRFGMHLRACGDNPHAVDAAGRQVGQIRLAAIMICGALSGLGGICFAYSISANFSSSIYVGYGYLAIAALIFGNWRILPTLGACLLFGFARSGGYRLVQVLQMPSSYQDLVMILPYVLTLLLLVFFSKQNGAPRALGVIYDKGAR